MYPLVTSTIYWICSSLQTWNKFKTSLIRGWDPPIWKNMKQKWKCSPILEQENLSVTKLPHELVSSPEKTYWGLIYKCYKSQKNLMRLQFKQSPLVLMKNSRLICQELPKFPAGEPWRFTCVSFGTALTTASKKGHFSCQNMLEVLVGCCQSVVSVFFFAWKKDGWNKRHSKQHWEQKNTHTHTHHCWKLIKFISCFGKSLRFFKNNV